MKIYKFQYRSWIGKLDRTEYEAEEKPKTYTLLDGWKSRISKREIGVVTGRDNDTVYLFEDDKKKAVKLLIEKHKVFLQMENGRHLKEVIRIEKVIKTLEET